MTILSSKKYFQMNHCDTPDNMNNMVSWYIISSSPFYSKYNTIWSALKDPKHTISILHNQCFCIQRNLSSVYFLNCSKALFILSDVTYSFTNIALMVDTPKKSLKQDSVYSSYFSYFWWLWFKKNIICIIRTCWFLWLVQMIIIICKY